MKKENNFFNFARRVRQVIRNVLDTRATKSGSSTAGSPAAWLSQFYGGSDSWSGVKVDENSALEYVYFWTSLKVIRETIASLPMVLYKKTSQGKERAENHPNYNILHLKANPEQTAYDYKEMTMGHYILYGNTYSEKIYNNSGQLVALWPLLPWKMEVFRENGKKIFRYTLPNDQRVILLPDQVLHIKNYSLCGLVGDRPIDFAGESIGSGLAADEYSARFFKNDASPGGIIEMPNNLGRKEENIKRFKQTWEKNYGSMTNKHRVAILEDGAKFHEVTATPEESQLLDMKKHQGRLMASFHRLPPHLIGDLDNATYSNIEEQSLEFISYTMLPHFVRMEQNFTIQTLSEKEQKKYFYEILITALARADIEKRYNAYRTGREIGILSPDECRALENLNKIPGGKGEVYHIPANWVELGTKPPEPEPQQQQQQQEGEGEEEPENENEENKLLLILKEQRTLRSANVRHNISLSFRPVYADIMRRLRKREISDLKKNVKKWLIERSKPEFETWYREYYTKFDTVIQERTAPVYNSINSAVYKEVQEEVGEIKKEREQKEYIDKYIEVYAYEYTRQSKRDIGRYLNDALKNEKDIEENFDLMYEEWESKIEINSQNEVTNSSNAFAWSAYFLAGVQFLRWVNTGASTCPLCREMDGKIVGINEPFLPADGSIETEEKNFNTSKNINFAPLHGGCECQIMAG